MVTQDLEINEISQHRPLEQESHSAGRSVHQKNPVYLEQRYIAQFYKQTESKNTETRSN